MLGSASKAVTLAAAVSLLVASTPVQANQCVRNKFGSLITTIAQWYKPSDIGYYEKNGTYYIQQKKTGNPVFTQTIASDQIGCTNSNTQYTVVLTVADGKFAAELVTLAVGTVIAAIGGAICVGTAGAGCPAAAAAGATLIAGFTAIVMPNGSSLFSITTPGTTYAFDTWGTVFKPEAGIGTCKVPAIGQKAKDCGVSHTIMGQ